MHETDFILRHNELLAKHTINKQYYFLLSSTYNHESDIHEHGKHQNEWTTQVRP